MRVGTNGSHVTLLGLILAARAYEATSVERRRIQGWLRPPPVGARVFVHRASTRPQLLAALSDTTDEAGWLLADTTTIRRGLQLRPPDPDTPLARLGELCEAAERADPMFWPTRGLAGDLQACAHTLHELRGDDDPWAQTVTDVANLTTSVAEAARPLDLG